MKASRPLRRFLSLLFLPALAACGGANPGTRYPVSGDMARQSHDIYASPAERQGSLVDAVPSARRIFGTPRVDPLTGQRLTWGIYGQETPRDGVELTGLEAGVPVPPVTDDPAPGAVSERSRALWKAAMEVVSLMPLRMTDPAKGVILSDWYTLPKFPDQRVKVGIYVIGRALTRESLRVTIQRQQRNNEGEWRDVPAAPGSIVELERTILRRAQELARLQLPPD